MIEINQVKRKHETQRCQPSEKKNKPCSKKLNEGIRTKEYGLKIERQVFVWVSCVLMLKKMALELRSRISFSHWVAFLFFSCSSSLSLPFLKMNFSLHCFSIDTII